MMYCGRSGLELQKYLFDMATIFVVGYAINTAHKVHALITVVGMISLALRKGRIPDKIVIYRMIRENTCTVPSISNVGPCPLTTGRQTDLITPFKP